MPMKRFGSVAALVAVAIVITARAASAQQWVCYRFAIGETADAAALRITGYTRHASDAHFQILDPAASRFIAKRRYARVRPHWLACSWSTRGGAVQMVNSAAVTAPLARQQSPIERPIAGVRLDPFWCAIVVLLIAPFGIYRAERYWTQRRAAAAAMMQFGRSVIREFERPLTHLRDPARPLDSRLRIKPHRRRVDVLLAPASGRQYPNLSDHRMNVQYDLERIRAVLRHEPFVVESMRQRGKWVVLSFRATGNRNRQVSCERPSPQSRRRWWKYSAVGENHSSA